MNEFKVVSFYTGNGVYAEMAGRLRESCDKFKIECDIEEYKDRGSWVDNCNIKPEFILKKIKQTHPDTPLTGRAKGKKKR